MFLPVAEDSVPLLLVVLAFSSRQVARRPFHADLLPNGETTTCGLPLTGTKVAVLTTNFELRREEMQEACRSLEIFEQPERSTLARFMETFDHAGLIYALQGLTSRSAALPYMAETLALLRMSLHDNPTSPFLARNLNWPLFVSPNLGVIEILKSGLRT